MDNVTVHTVVDASLQKTSSPVRDQSQSGRQDASARYMTFIQSCYRRHPAASGYYRALEDYIAASSTTSLQAPRRFVIQAPTAHDVHSSERYPFEEREPDTPSSQPSLVILEGFPAPICIAELGAGLNIRPEMFIGYLDFGRLKFRGHSYFELPTLPSMQDNALHIRFASLTQSLVASDSLLSGKDQRAAAAARCLRAEKTLFSEGQYGATRRRALHLHDSRYSTVEQIISVSVCTSGTGGSWQIVCLLDGGKEPVDAIHSLRGSESTSDHLLTQVPSVPYCASQIGSQPRPTGTVETMLASLDPSHPLKNIFVRSDVDHRLLYADPFFIIGSILATSVRSWNTVINFLDCDIRDCQDGEPSMFDHVTEQLRFNIGLLDRIDGYLSDQMCIIRAGGSEGWPRTDDGDLLNRRDRLQASLRTDYQRVIERCRRLSKACEAAMGTLASAAQLAESQKAIKQAARVTALTRLAFFFIPLGFAASLFGMNVAELSPNPSIWVFVLVAVPLTLLSWITANWSDVTHRTPVIWKHFWTRVERYM